MASKLERLREILQGEQAPERFSCPIDGSGWHRTECTGCQHWAPRDSTVIKHHGTDCAWLRIDVILAEPPEPPRGGCPCTLIEPCGSSCTCAQGFMSGGCRRCARYGSLEQRVEMAKRLVEGLSEN